MGAACEVLLESDDGATLGSIDATLASLADRIDRTRKGRVWFLILEGSSIDVHLDGSPPTVKLSSRRNAREDSDVLRRLAAEIAKATNGLATEPEN